MIRIIFLLTGFAICSISGYPQTDKRNIRQGNRLYKSEKFTESETSYRKALEAGSWNPVAGFNLGDALYRQEKFEEAGKQFEANAGREGLKENTSKAYHNLGNSLLQSGKIDESIEAYKEALRKNPEDMDTKYNLAYAMNLKKQQQQNKNQQDQQNKDNQQDKQDQQNQQNQNQNQNKNQDQNQQQPNQQNADKRQDDQKTGENQPQQAKISREDARRLLEALANDEKKVQEKVKKEKAKAVRVRTLKDW